MLVWVLVKNKQDRIFPKGRQAFSLIELLVVIAIIAVLASLLTPTIGQAKKNSKTRKCSANLRQMGVLADTYSADHDGDMVMPFTGHTNSRGDNWVNAFPVLLGMTDEVAARTKQSVMHCPTQFEFMVKKLHVNNWRHYTYTQNHQLTSEAFGLSVRNGTTPPPPPAPQVRSNMKPLKTSINSIPGVQVGGKPATPDTVAYFLDGWSRAGSAFVSWRIWVHNGYINGGGPGDLENAFPHDWKSNVVFLDGHVETTTYQEGMWYGAWNPTIWANARYWDRPQGDYGSASTIRAF